MIKRKEPAITRQEKLAALFLNSARRPLNDALRDPKPAEAALLAELGNLSDRTIGTRFDRMTKTTTAKLTGQPGPRDPGRPRTRASDVLIEYIDQVRAQAPNATDADIVRLQYALLTLAVQYVKQQGVTFDAERVTTDPAYSIAMASQLDAALARLREFLEGSPDKAEPMLEWIATYAKRLASGTDRHAREQRREVKATLSAVSRRRRKPAV